MLITGLKMSDEIDLANDHAYKMLQVAVKAARGVAINIEGDGYCFSCNEIVIERNGMIPRFCDMDCAKDFERG